MQSSSQIVTTNKPNTQLFTGQMPFLSPIQQCQNTETREAKYLHCALYDVINDHWHEGRHMT